MMERRFKPLFFIVRDQDKLVIANSRAKEEIRTSCPSHIPQNLSSNFKLFVHIVYPTCHPFCCPTCALPQSKCQIIERLSQSTCDIVKFLTSLLEGHSSTIPLYHTFRNVSSIFLNEYLYKIENFVLFSKRNDVLSLFSAADFVKFLTSGRANE